MTTKDFLHSRKLPPFLWIAPGVGTNVSPILAVVAFNFHRATVRRYTWALAVSATQTAVRTAAVPWWDEIVFTSRMANDVSPIFSEISIYP